MVPPPPLGHPAALRPAPPPQGSAERPAHRVPLALALALAHRVLQAHQVQPPHRVPLAHWVPQALALTRQSRRQSRRQSWC